MGSFSDYAEDALLDHLVGKSSLTMPTSFIALSTADPTDDGSGMAEPSGNNYARVETSASDWDSASGGATANAAAISFPTASGSWGTISYAALYDAATDGNMLAHGALDTPVAVGADQIFTINIGDLDITLD